MKTLLKWRGISIFFAWYDFWVGFFWDKDRKILYICPVPMFGIKIKFHKTFEEPKFYRIPIHNENKEVIGYEINFEHIHNRKDSYYD